MIHKDLELLRAALKPEHRLLGLDVGAKTVGIAISDAARIVASPLSTLERVRADLDIEAVRRIAESETVGGVIIGLPVSMDGTEGRQCQRVRGFGDRLRPRVGVPVLYWDERLSTAAVQRVLIDEADMSRRRRGEIVDKMAASYILQGVLDALVRP
ncbi:MAG: Holliday junction resolvase RuvX [Rhodospirillales bacterium]|nr:Holliday junction resolvase RuvX [Rhodospirillales bacterium]